ncbi:S41 family peptidase [Gluconobacter thailandicus]|uniref:Tail specific protease domain-containing protein n=1 Tax=Gluconobacter thailandicus TaxID=257438 RepID=A0AAP9EUT7_GLUTH|nr:S41 family peptidase [Gluconobacter thailandicus]QEH97793.1 hypothetical protein FXF46_15975 [Gluconobacter thailandicus]
MMKHPIFRWLLRVLLAIVALVFFVFLGLLIYFFAVVEPRNQEAARQAEIFQHLKGPARNLAIFDAAASLIDAHYYDPHFSGMDWPKLRAEMRRKAEMAPNNFELYWSVLYQLAQLFPASHMGFTAPSARLPASTQSAQKTKSMSPTRCETTLGSSGLWLSTVRRLNSRILIIGEIDPGSPAAEAGLRPGWPLQMYTERVDAGHTHVIVDVLPLSDADVRKLALHNTLPSLSPGPRHFDFETRCVPDKTHFESRQLPDGTLYIRFNDFNASETASVASVLQGAGMHPVILDLRYNEGGFASLLLDHLIPHGMPLYNIQDRTGTHTLRARYESPQYDGRLAVLIGPSTSSAAEISAWVLHQAGRAILIGRPTNGSVLGSRNYPLPDGGSIQIAVDNVTMPDGTVLESRGIAPDIEIEPTPDQLRAGRDPALEAADRALHR